MNNTAITSIVDIKFALNVARAELKDFEKEMENFEIVRSIDDYKEFLNDCYDDIEVCGGTYSVGEVLEAIDPTAFRCGMVDWVDSLDKEEEPEYQELMEKAEELENEIEDLESQIEEIKEINQII